MMGGPQRGPPESQQQGGVSDSGEAAQVGNTYYCKSVPPMPDPWRQPNASDDLIGLHPERVAFVKQQEAHFTSRLRLATLRPRAVYGPGLLSNTLPHQTKFFCLHQPLPPLPIPEAHRYHRFTLVDLLEHDAPEVKAEAGTEELSFFHSLSGSNSSSSSSSDKSAKAAAANVAAFLLSAARTAALGEHAFRKVPIQQQQQQQPVAGSSLLRSFSAQSIRQQQLQQQHSSSSSAIGAASSVSSRRGRADSYVSSNVQRQLQQKPHMHHQQQLYVQQQPQQQGMLPQQQGMLPQQQGMLPPQQQEWSTLSEARQEKRRKPKRRKLEDW
ncbi:hypothetical protein, conserved [Eimeria tenella]|uniref:Uncharacterized protein n=1 Tax=Eimeria tenella TaxID=5802 RepID=U6KRP0_EIMTE|nr:hypothetical protein, conserved [Eimeria tenella]CDJ39014.1 hypothetical protein, conserved [Eimeria tenella]|eukprot:XP_013229769.1 hypothetical protein, conserved [Eimeria tenella]